MPSVSEDPSHCFPEAFKPRIKGIADTLDEVFKTESFHKRNAARRRLYTQLEILVMDMEEEGSVDPQVSEVVTDMKKELTLETFSSPSSIFTTFFSFARISAVAIILFAAGLWMILTLPVRYTLHPLLQRMGLRNEQLPLDIVNYYLAVWLVAVAGVKFRVEGLDEVGSRPYLGLYAHASNLDPLLLLAADFKQPKFIGKIALFLIPFFGWGLRFGMGHLPISRSSTKSAIKTLHNFENALRINQFSLFIAPEGTRTPHGQLQEFKKGAFHSQASLKCPIVVITIFGAFELWPRNRLFIQAGRVVIRYSKPWLPPDGMDVEQIRRTTRRKTLMQLSDHPEEDLPSALSTLEMLHCLVLIFAAWSFGGASLWSLWWIRSTLLATWSTAALAGSACAFTVFMEALILKI